MIPRIEEIEQHLKAGRTIILCHRLVIDTFREALKDVQDIEVFEHLGNQNGWEAVTPECYRNRKLDKRLGREETTRGGT